LPALRDRATDVIEIAESFLLEFSGQENKQFTGFDPDVMSLMMSYSWPGNVRELQNVIRHIVVLHDGNLVRMNQMPVALLQHQTDETDLSLEAPAPVTPMVEGNLATAVPDPALASTVQVRPLWITEREAIEQAIEACGGNVPKAAALLEVSPSTLYRKRQQWNDRDAQSE